MQDRRMQCVTCNRHHFASGFACWLDFVIVRERCKAPTGMASKGGKQAAKGGKVAAKVEVGGKLVAKDAVIT